MSVRNVAVREQKGLNIWGVDVYFEDELMTDMFFFNFNTERWIRTWTGFAYSPCMVEEGEVPSRLRDAAIMWQEMEGRKQCLVQ